MNLNFELILFYLTLISGLLALLDILFFAPRRQRLAMAHGPSKMPIVFDYARSFFPVLLLVFILRSFLVEPFRIPSGSLEPTLLTGDFILVNKFKYGIRLPILHTKLFGYDKPQRGDIMVFRWPADESYNFIKRVIGLPGDKISYINKKLYINGQEIQQKEISQPIMNLDTSQEWQAQMKQEDLLGVKHNIFVEPNRTSRNYFDITVPKGMYFVMGDNRDESADSRFWGFVPDKNIVGKGVFVWMSWNSHDYSVRFKRIGRTIH